MTKFFNKFKKPCFDPFLVHFPALLRTTSYGFLAPLENLEKLMIQFQENARTYGRAERRTEGRIDPIL